MARGGRAVGCLPSRPTSGRRPPWRVSRWIETATAPATASAVRPDTSAPSGMVLINGGEETTTGRTVTLILSVGDPDSGSGGLIRNPVDEFLARVQIVRWRKRDLAIRYHQETLHQRDGIRQSDLVSLPYHLTNTSGWNLSPGGGMSGDRSAALAPSRVKGAIKNQEW